ncbi:hypothetical protein MKW98_022829 [Papaver atlanticum]|uniref:Uncharacterized protein n=1 Tax=Papaver atlanticum TaxID=357466 RepID=A0AAD4TIP0_9MAGN|nr:hypothetical protein MKW98_022829 [Papaver atlanticum]
MGIEEEGFLICCVSKLKILFLTSFGATYCEVMTAGQAYGPMNNSGCLDGKKLCKLREVAKSIAKQSVTEKGKGKKKPMPATRSVLIHIVNDKDIPRQNPLLMKWMMLSDF